MRKTYLRCLGISLLLFVSPTLLIDAQVNRGDIERLLKRLEENTDRFSKSLDSALDKSNINGTRAEDEINGYVHDFEEATDRLKDRYGDDGGASDSAREVLVRGQHIDRFMRKYPMGPRAEGDWQVVRSDLDTLARLYRIKWRW